MIEKFNMSEHAKETYLRIKETEANNGNCDNNLPTFDIDFTLNQLGNDHIKDIDAFLDGYWIPYSLAVGYYC